MEKVWGQSLNKSRLKKVHSTLAANNVQTCGRCLLHFADNRLIYTVRHKKLHTSYSYNNFAKLCHIMIIFGT